MKNIDMDKEKIIDELNEIAEDAAGVELEEDTDIIEEQIMDSLELVTFLNEIEEKYDVTITIDDLEKKGIKVISKLAEYIIDNA